MEQATFNLIDAINCSGIDNSLWGCSQGIESTKHHFGTIEDMALERMFIYVYRDEDNTSFIPKTTPSLTLTLEEWGRGYLIFITSNNPGRFIPPHNTFAT